MSRPALVLLVFVTACASSAPPHVAAPRAETRAQPRRTHSAANDALEAGLADSLPPGTWTPPISGGTLLITHDGTRAVAADADRDRVWVADFANVPFSIEGYVALRAGDEPGRLVEDAEGRVFVALRHAGAIAEIDVERREEVARWEVCASPRGLAVEEHRLHVACAGGDLLSLSTATGETLDAERVAGDLRDVGVDGEGLWVSRFRSAEWMRPGGEANRLEPVELTVPGFSSTGEVGRYGAAVAWRTFADESGITMVHQRHYMDDLTSALVGSPQYYGSGAVKSAVSRWEDGELQWSQSLNGVLPVDGASIGGGAVAVVYAGSNRISVTGPSGARDSLQGLWLTNGAHQPIAIAHHPDLGIVVQTRANPSLMIYRRIDDRGWSRAARLSLGDYIFFDRPRGDELFHQASGAVACASCHPEGADDGHVWRLEAEPRRTQPLRGGIAGKGAFHWTGDLPTFDALLNNTWVRRMGGGELSDFDVRSVAQWLDRVPDPAPARVVDASAVARGRVVFEDAQVGCRSCHSGQRGTDGRLHDVGTGGVFMTPALVGLARRAPYLHDGCAETLEARLGTCHTRGHGRIRHLTDAQSADLLAYMRSL